MKTIDLEDVAADMDTYSSFMREANEELKKASAELDSAIKNLGEGEPDIQYAIEEIEDAQRRIDKLTF